MKRMAAVLAALGISTAAFAFDSPDVSQLPPGESAYGYSMSDPYADAYSDEYVVVEEIILVPADSIVLIPMEDEEVTSHFPG